jgi:hypothetical protein
MHKLCLFVRGTAALRTPCRKLHRAAASDPPPQGGGLAQWADIREAHLLTAAPAPLFLPGRDNGWVSWCLVSGFLRIVVVSALRNWLAMKQATPAVKGSLELGNHDRAFDGHGRQHRPSAIADTGDDDLDDCQWVNRELDWSTARCNCHGVNRELRRRGLAITELHGLFFDRGRWEDLSHLHQMLATARPSCRHCLPPRQVRQFHLASTSRRSNRSETFRRDECRTGSPQPRQLQVWRPELPRRRWERRS